MSEANRNYAGAQFICHVKVRGGVGVEPRRDADIRMLALSAASIAPAKGLAEQVFLGDEISLEFPEKMD